MNKINKLLSASLFSLLVTTSLAAAEIKQMATDKVQNKITETKSNIANKATTFVKDTIQKYVPNTEVSITGMEDAKPQWEILTMQPIRDTGDDLTFFQGSLLRWDGDRDTINLGLGQRKFLLDKNILMFSQTLSPQGEAVSVAFETDIVEDASAVADSLAAHTYRVMVIDLAD